MTVRIGWGSKTTESARSLGCRREGGAGVGGHPFADSRFLRVGFIVGKAHGKRQESQLVLVAGMRLRDRELIKDVEEPLPLFVG